MENSSQPNIEPSAAWCLLSHTLFFSSLHALSKWDVNVYLSFPLLQSLHSIRSPSLFIIGLYIIFSISVDNACSVLESHRYDLLKTFQQQQMPMTVVWRMKNAICARFNLHKRVVIRKIVQYSIPSIHHLCFSCNKERNSLPIELLWTSCYAHSLTFSRVRYNWPQICSFRSEPFQFPHIMIILVIKNDSNPLTAFSAGCLPNQGMVLQNYFEAWLKIPRMGQRLRIKSCRTLFKSSGLTL